MGTAAALFAAHVERHPTKSAATATALLSAVDAGDRERGRLLAVALRSADRCAVCGRVLRNDESKAAGIGPECRHKTSEATRALEALRSAGFDVLDPADLEAVPS